MKFSEIKSKIKNLGNLRSIKEIKQAGLRVVKNTKTDDYWLIEEEFLKPVIKSPRECKNILVKLEDLRYKVFICNKSKKELEGTNALKYIEWGERKGFDKKPTVRGRKLWWQNPDFSSHVFMQMTFNDVFKFWYVNDKIRCDARLYTISLKNKLDVYLLNSTLSVFFIELFGRANLGEGGLDFKVYEAKNILFLDKNNIKINKWSDSIFARPVKSIFEECGIDPKSEIPIEEQEPKPLPDRAELDKIVFDALDLTKDERKETYRAVCRLVWNRINKARSL